MTGQTFVADPRLSCMGKTLYENYTRATAHATRVYLRTSRQLEVYRCHHCSRWHVATARPREVRNPKARAQPPRQRRWEYDDLNLMDDDREEAWHAEPARTP